jgi:hypothetical protein
MSLVGSRHADFEKSHSAFLAHYSKDPKLGESRYVDWVKFSGLDETRSYYLHGAARANKSKQSFNRANFLLYHFAYRTHLGIETLHIRFLTFSVTWLSGLFFSECCWRYYVGSDFLISASICL